MKKCYTLWVLFTVCVIAPVLGQDMSDSHYGLFNITKVSFMNTSDLERKVKMPNDEVVTTNLENSIAYGWSVHTVNGFYLSPSWSLGIGTGIEWYNGPDYNSFPVYLDVRTYVVNEHDAWFIYADLGPTLQLGGDDSLFKKGFLLQGGIGYKFEITKAWDLQLDAFYTDRSISLTNEGFSDSDDRLTTKSIGFGLGVVF